MQRYNSAEALAEHWKMPYLATLQKDLLEGDLLRSPPTIKHVVPAAGYSKV